MEKFKHKNYKPRAQQRKRRKRRGQGQVLQGGEKPTLTLKGKFILSTTVSPGTSKRIDVAPMLNMFGAQIYKQADNFEQYRIPRINVKFININNVSTVSQSLTYVFSVPITTPTIPGPDQASFLAYKNCKYHSYSKDFSQSFVPYVQTADGLAPFLLSPKLAAQNIQQVHYGYSFLFTNFGTTTIRIVAIVQADVQYFKYDGHMFHGHGQLNKLNQDYQIVKNLTDIAEIRDQQSLSNQPKSWQSLDSSRQSVNQQPMSKALLMKLLQRAGIQKNPGPLTIGEVADEQDKPPDPM